MTQKARKDGFPVLAYSSLDDPAPMLSSLFFRTKSPRRATLSLKFVSIGSGHGDAPNFILQINPSNLVPGENSLTPAKTSLPQERLDQVQRQGNPNIRTLSLTLGQWCSVWYPKSITTTPLRGVHPHLDELASLSTASKLHLLFDMNWLGNEKKGVFEEFIHYPDRFTGCPVEEHYSKKYEHLDWTLFDAPAYRDSTTDEEDPTPLYSGAIVKRARPTSTPSPPPSSSKRILTSSGLETIHGNTIETGAGMPHPEPKHFSRASTVALSSSPYPGTPRRDLRLVVENVLEQSLMGRISSLLPSLIEHLVTATPPSPSQRSVASQISTTPPPLDLTPFGKALGDYIMEQISAKFDDLYEQTLSHADFRRRVADDEFYDQVEGERLALNREAESTFEELKQKCEDLEEDVTERVQWRVDEIFELLEKRLGDLDSEEPTGLAYGNTELGRKRARLRRKSAELNTREEELRSERAEFRREKADFRREKAEMRKEKAELKKEEQLRARAAREALDNERDFSFPALPDCCVLP